MKRTLIMLAIAAVVIAAADTQVFAQATGTTGSTNVFTSLQNKASDVFYNARTIILIICALAIVGTMATAISGRFPIGKSIAIMGAIVVIGLASEIVTYFSTASSSPQATTYTLTDTAQGGAP